ncbi:MAG: aldo/keto reductase [Planctomycetaceae bacterium]|nr:aldo/keto reductase [Planctomycetaceae bacterium]
MQTRSLGSSSLQLTTVGIGTWAIGGGDWKFGWGPQDESEAITAIHQGVLDCGINWIDTAAVYGDGRSEEIVGKALATLPAEQRPLVATKCSRVVQADGNITGVLKRESIVNECEASLRRLNIDVIDLYQLHWPDPEAHIEEGWQTLVDLKKQGKIREIGVSNHSPGQIDRLRPIHPVASLQPPYSMITQQIEAQTLPYCKQHQIGIICYSPMGKGLLTGAFDRTRAEALPQSDHRSRDPKFQEPLLGINLHLVEGLRDIAARQQRPLAQLAIAWCLRKPEVTSAIVGARNPNQIKGTAPAGDWLLQNEEIEEIDRLLTEREVAIQQLGPIDTGRV